MDDPSIFASLDLSFFHPIVSPSIHCLFDLFLQSVFVVFDLVHLWTTWCTYNQSAYPIRDLNVQSLLSVVIFDTKLLPASLLGYSSTGCQCCLLLHHWGYFTSYLGSCPEITKRCEVMIRMKNNSSKMSVFCGWNGTCYIGPLFLCPTKSLSLSKLLSAGSQRRSNNWSSNNDTSQHKYCSQWSLGCFSFCFFLK